MFGKEQTTSVVFLMLLASECFLASPIDRETENDAGYLTTKPEPLKRLKRGISTSCDAQRYIAGGLGATAALSCVFATFFPPLLAVCGTAGVGASAFANRYLKKMVNNYVTDADTMNRESEKKNCDLDILKPEYPRRVFFIIGNEFCERFCFYGMKAVLQTYLMIKLNQDPDTAASLYHAFAIVSYFMPVPGAILADSFIGRYWTIFSLSIVYVIGNIIMATTAIGPGYLEGALVGMFTIAIGTGGIKPCVSAFGADQFTKEQSHMTKSFFSMFYVSINAGSLLSQFITPIIKSTPCFGEEECWVLAFGLPAALMVTALMFFLVGTPFYTRAPVTENVMFKMCGAIVLAIKRRGNSQTSNHWLDRAVPEYTQEFVDGCKAVFRVLVLFIPLPLFWSLFDQKGSRWVYQAQKMNTYIDFFDAYLEAEQMQICNGIIVVCMVPVFDAFIYPMFAKCNLFVRPLQRMVAGCALAAAAFFIIGSIQLEVNKNDILNRSDPATFRTRIFNLHPSCKFDLWQEWEGKIDKDDADFKQMALYDTFLYGPGRANNGTIIHFKNIQCPSIQPYNDSFQIVVDMNRPISTIFFDNRRRISIVYGDGSFPTNDKGTVQKEYLYQILMSSYTPLTADKITKMAIVKAGEEVGGAFLPKAGVNPADVTRKFDTKRVPSQYYQVKYWLPDGTWKVHPTYLYLLQGGVYTAYLTEQNGEFKVDLLIDKNANLVSVYYQIIAYFVLTWGEILFSITGLSFAFSQAPANMKSILTAGWLLTTSFGNLIDLIIIEIQIPDKAVEFFLFAGLMVVVTIIFAILTKFYKYVDESEQVPSINLAPSPTVPYFPPPPPYAPTAYKVPLAVEEDKKQAIIELAPSKAYYNAALSDNDESYSEAF